MTDRYLFRGFHPCENGTESVWIEGKKIKGIWCYGFLFERAVDCETVVCIGEKPLWANDYGEIVIDEMWVIPETVGQYICDDKHGNHIFENDVLKCLHRYMYNHRGYEEEEPREDIKFAYGYHERETHISKDRYYYRNYVIEKYKMIWRIRNKNIIHNLTNSFVFNHDIEVISSIHSNPDILERKE